MSTFEIMLVANVGLCGANLALSLIGEPSRWHSFAGWFIATLWVVHALLVNSGV